MSTGKLKIQTRISRPQRPAFIPKPNMNLVRDVSALIESPVIATNGETGKVRDFLFDDQSWQICSVVIDAGSWLRRRDVVLPISFFEFPDWASKSLRVNLTRAQVRSGPDIDSEKPVWRQQGLAMREYFGALACWVDAEFGLSSFPTGLKFPSPPGENPHLRSVQHLAGYRVRATDGYMGHVAGFLMDDASWRLGYLEVRVSRQLHRPLVAVPSSWVDRISWAEFRMYLRHRRPAV